MSSSFNADRSDRPRDLAASSHLKPPKRIKLVEPGYGPTTRFASNGPSPDSMIPEAYAPFARRILAAFAKPAAVTSESDVAEAVYRAANDTSGQLRFPAGPDAVALARSAGRPA